MTVPLILLGVVIGFAAGAAFTVWWFRAHIRFAERSPGFRSRRA